MLSIARSGTSTVGPMRSSTDAGSKRRGVSKKQNHLHAAETSSNPATLATTCATGRPGAAALFLNPPHAHLKRFAW
jgi:hypothetical protein